MHIFCLNKRYHNMFIYPRTTILLYNTQTCGFTRIEFNVPGVEKHFCKAQRGEKRRANIKDKRKGN